MTMNMRRVRAGVMAISIAFLAIRAGYGWIIRLWDDDNVVWFAATIFLLMMTVWAFDEWRETKL